LLAATEPGDLVQRELRAVRPLPARYGTAVGAGALVLVGDTAHGMAEYLGQGACLALEDVATLVAAVRDAVPGPALHAAVDAYGATRRPRIAEVLRRSRRLGATGPVARRGAVHARRRGRAAATAAGWRPPVR
jgi:2-polyprenyl-6-methoxyphenol hydroxylase-like FAD-dependent oxidoreductase